MGSADHLMLRIHFFWLMHDAPFAVFGTKSVDLPTQSLGSLLNPVWPDDQTIRQLLSRLSNLWDLCAAYQICGAWTFSLQMATGTPVGKRHSEVL